MKADLQNSTARLWKQNASATDNHQYMITPGLYPFDSEINFIAQGDDHLETSLQEEKKNTKEVKATTAYQCDNHPPKNKKTVLIVRFIICSHAPLIEKLTHTVPMEPAPPRHPHGTQNILLSAASVKT